MMENATPEFEQALVQRKMHSNCKQWKRMIVWKRMFVNLYTDAKKTGSKGYVDIQKEHENSMEGHSE